MARKFREIQDTCNNEEVKKAQMGEFRVKSLDYPLTDSEGYTTGIFSDFEYLEPTGEIKQNKDGSTWTDKNTQFKFVFTVPTEDGGEMNLNLYTNTGVDGYVDGEGNYSRLVTWLIAIGALDQKKLHKKFKADEEQIKGVIEDAFMGKFKFKFDDSERIKKPIHSSFEWLEDEEDNDDKNEDTPTEPKNPGGVETKETKELIEA